MAESASADADLACPPNRNFVEVAVRYAQDRRNFIEGLFLSSGIIKSPDDTMGSMVRIARELRTAHDFRGYIHLKTIPDASPGLVEEAGL